MRRSTRPLIAAFASGLLLAALLVLLGLQFAGLSFPGFLLTVYPALFLWELGYRGSLIDWGDGWVWLTDPGIALVYGPVVLTLSWLCGRALFRLRKERVG
jgi:hypothetical protein